MEAPRTTKTLWVWGWKAFFGLMHGTARSRSLPGFYPNHPSVPITARASPRVICRYYCFLLFTFPRWCVTDEPSTRRHLGTLLPSSKRELIAGLKKKGRKRERTSRAKQCPPTGRNRACKGKKHLDVNMYMFYIHVYRETCVRARSSIVMAPSDSPVSGMGWAHVTASLSYLHTCFQEKNPGFELPAPLLSRLAMARAVASRVGGRKGHAAITAQWSPGTGGIAVGSRKAPALQMG